MKTLYLAPPVCRDHDPNPGHPECPERLVVIDSALAEAGLDLQREEVMPATKDDLLLAHDPDYIDFVFDSMPSGRALDFLDADTAICAQSGDAALHAVGAVLHAVDAVLEGRVKNAFCSVRPPGHHAHRNHAAGFCLFNTIAIGALYALQRHGLSRVAIVDFDVHHGDGTQDIVRHNPGIFLASTYQYPLYASTAETASETGIASNVLNIPFDAGTTGQDAVAVWKKTILPRVAAFDPQMVLVSAGFDAHRDDPLAGLAFLDADYAELMREIKDLAETHCKGRLVAVLEGGYNLNALASSMLACLNVLGE